MEPRTLTKSTQDRPSIFDSRGWLDRFFNSPLDEYFNFGRAISIPSVNVNETDDKYTLSIATPGLERKDIHVELDGNMLTIKAEKEEKEKEEKNGKFNRREYNYSSWSRSFTLPEDADGAGLKAEYKNGELRVEMARSAKHVKANVKKIAVN
jgi:HSP20 family protein